MTPAEFTGEKPPCDLVMKGGLASDVVYPLAIVELAKKYRLNSIGGTSSGALAAAIAAAAEYARDDGGFQRLAEIPDETAETPPVRQFQPVPRLKPLFNMLMVALGNKGPIAKGLGIIFSAVAGYPGPTLLGLLPGLLIVFALASRSHGWLFFGLLLALVGGTLSLSRRVMLAITKELPEANFGLCSGLTLSGNLSPAITDWLADTIDRIAGNVAASHPLTFGDLKTNHNRPPLQLVMITTDLAMKRPYQLPFQDGADMAHFFSKGDFAKLFPVRVVEHMCRDKKPLEVSQCWKDCPDDLYPFPTEHELPIVVATRMSLSFPFLIQAVPLYKCDLTLKHGSDEPRKCLFSDGGLTSNFPIHFFDRLWPNSPTFGIAFDEFSKQRHLEGTKEIRVDMAHDLTEGEFLPIIPIIGIGGFLTRLVETARDWQDNLQSVLPGYRERIVHVHLKPEEGGLNLDMPPDLIRTLTDIGRDVGVVATGPTFKMDEHRWRRFLISMAEIEQTLDGLADSYEGSSVPGGSFHDFLNRYRYEGSHPPKDEAWRKETLRRAKLLVAVGKRWRKDPTVRSGRIPKPECDFRIVPRQ